MADAAAPLAARAAIGAGATPASAPGRGCGRRRPAYRASTTAARCGAALAGGRAGGCAARRAPRLDRDPRPAGSGVASFRDRWAARDGGSRALVIADFVATSTANACRVTARSRLRTRSSRSRTWPSEHGGGPGGAPRRGRRRPARRLRSTLAAALAAAGTTVLPARRSARGATRSSARPSGVTGARARGRGRPAASCSRPGPGAPRATSLLRRCPRVPRRGDRRRRHDRRGHRRRSRPRDLPSAVTWVGGPSRTSDLEMRPTFGIHGPKAVEVVLVDIPEHSGPDRTGGRLHTRGRS